jgi:hypothetical protein
MRWVIIFAGLLVAAAIGGGVTRLYSDRTPKPVPPFELSPTEFHDLTLTPGTHEFIVRIKNPADMTRRIVGYKTGCWESYCTYTDYTGTISVPGNGEFEFRCGLEVGRAGPINAGIEIYLEDNGIRSVLISFKGMAVGPHDVPNPP